MCLPLHQEGRNSPHVQRDTWRVVKDIHGRAAYRQKDTGGRGVKTARTSSIVPAQVLDNLESLKTLREVSGLSRQDLAEKTGISLCAIRGYENNNVAIGRKNYNKLAKFFEWEEWN